MKLNRTSNLKGAWVVVNKTTGKVIERFRTNQSARDFIRESNKLCEVDELELKADRDKLSTSAKLRVVNRNDKM